MIRFKINKILRQEKPILLFFKIRIEEYLPPPWLKLKKPKMQNPSCFVLPMWSPVCVKSTPRGGLIAIRHREYAD